MNNCCDDETKCEPHDSPDCCKPHGCECTNGQCPKCAVEMLKCSFKHALHETQVEIFKAKIKKTYGPMMEQAADAIMESVNVCWQAKTAQMHEGDACEALKEKICAILHPEAKK